MTLSIGCIECGRLVRVKDELAGRRIKCPHCGAVQPAGAPPSPHPPVATSAADGGGSALHNFFLICMMVSVVVGIGGCLVGSIAVRAIAGIIQLGFFAGVAAFSTVCVFAPNHILASPTIARIVGVKNPIVSRIICGLAALVLWGLLVGSLFALTAKKN